MNETFDIQRCVFGDARRCIFQGEEATYGTSPGPAVRLCSWTRETPSRIGYATRTATNS